MPIRPGQAITSTGGGGGGGGGSQTLANITGTLGTLKGGTGLNATDLGDLRQKLGIANPSNPSDEYLDYCVDTRHQPNNTIQRVDASTSNALSDVADGLIVKVGDDQVMINLADGKQWVRSHTTGSTRTSWTTPVDAGLTELVSEAQIRGMTDGAVAYTTQNAWLPQYPDNTRPAKVIIARVGEYLIACARYNMWWSPRPTTDTWAQVPWRWEGNSQVPQGLEFSGGVNDEDRIPAGAVAVLGNKENVDQDSAGYILLMTKHTFNATSNGGTSTFTGYFVDDDASKTLKRSTSTITLTTDHWGRVKVDADGIEDAIITSDRGSGDPVFHGIIPEISNLGFPGYTMVSSGTLVSNRGDVFYDSTQRSIRLRILETDPHLADLFHEDFEVELKKDASNYIRGVFNSITVIPGSQGIVYAQFREEDLETEGTIASGDTVEVLGHKSVITKTDHVLPINLGLDHGSAEAGKVLTMNSAGTNFASQSAFLIPSSLAPPTITKSGEYSRVNTIGSNKGEFTISGTQIGLRFLDGDPLTFWSNLQSQHSTTGRPIIAFKDANNYIRFHATAQSGGSGLALFTLDSTRVYTRGSVSNGDSVRFFLEPANAYRSLRYDATGENLILSDSWSTSPRYIYGIQNQAQTVNNNGNSWTDANFETTTLYLDDIHNRESPALVTITAVANAGHGTVEGIGFEGKLQAKWASTEAGVISETTWTDMNSPGGPTFTGGLVFRSKVAAGQPAGQDQYRDYYIDVNRPIHLSSLPAGATNGQYVRFRMSIKKADTSFENISGIYGQALSITVYPSI